ncbi:MAG TPA: nucleoside-diphosphate sugar epimerase/dehydratase [Bryobacteraceae bacterium]|nr:nucleoside-diphosphate sugar epimerase/dehydratase [Bryobacteraceae bacterium]
MKHRLPNWVDRFAHLAVIVVALCAACELRFDFSIPDSVLPVIQRALLLAILLKAPVFEVSGFYRGIKRFAGIPDLFRILMGNIAASLALSIGAWLWLGPALPSSILVSDAILCLGGTTLLRFAVKIQREFFVRGSRLERRKGILIYGAGAGGTELLREIRSAPAAGYEVKGFLDDDPRKRRALILGVPVLGCGRDASAIVSRVNRAEPAIEEIIIAMPSATGRQMQEALANCRAARIPCKTIPGVGELLRGTVLSAQVRNVSVADLLGRKPVQLEETLVRERIAGRTVMVTGAAGSIGSEICRQVARCGPERLILFDQAESELFMIESELLSKQPEFDLVTALGDIRNAARLSEVLERNAVDSIFHAAAYKHVPMMESHAIEAISNNVLGTWNVVREARRHGVTDFLMISSDKAVNPANIMGATKRACERIVSSMPPDGQGTNCVSVRFGNVLGSNGSVVPTFQAQIAAGGPVRVTHPDIRRYFMTISEAVTLVLHASTLGKGSEIFVLDMGEPVRIVDLAENLIRLAGLVPYEDIDIQFTGLRPGEKLFEEITTEGENVVPTFHEKIKIFEEAPLPWEVVDHWLNRLKVLVAARQEAAAIAHLAQLVPEYRQSRSGAEAPDPSKKYMALSR